MTFCKLIGIEFTSQAELSRRLFDTSCKQKNDKRSKLFYLNQCIYINGIIHVGGRLRFAGLSENVKQPIFLPKNHSFILLIFNHYHNYLHAGPQL